MNIQDHKVVSFHYTVTDAEGTEVDTSRNKSEPMLYLHGSQNIIPGLEKAMQGHQAGDRFTVTIPPAEAYGERSAARMQRLSLKQLRVDARHLAPGMVLKITTNQGPAMVTVVKVGRFNVDVDANHPLAGMPLTFEVEIIDVRDATGEEKQHGHAHGAGGHGHE